MKEDCFHLGIKALVMDSEDNVLILQRPSKQDEGEIWDLPGGRVQIGESAEQTLKREVYEETGLTNLSSILFVMMELTKLRINCSSKDVGLIFALYHCKLSINESIALSDEHINYRWAHPIDASAMLESSYPEKLIQYLKEQALKII